MNGWTARPFRAGGYVEGVGIGVRVRVIARQLHRAHEDLVLVSWGSTAQGGTGIGPVEFYLNGSTLFPPDIYIQEAYTYDQALPFLRVGPASGLLEVWATNGGAAPTTLQAQLEGFYMPRGGAR